MIIFTIDRPRSKAALNLTIRCVFVWRGEGQEIAPARQTMPPIFTTGIETVAGKKA